MKAIILAGGSGIRMGKTGEEKPKCLLEIGGKPIIQHQIEALKKCGINEILVVTGFKKEMIEESLGDSVTYIDNEEYHNTNSAYGLWLTKAHANEGFIALNADLLFHIDILQKLIDSPHENAIMIDPKVELNSDMQKIIVKDNIIQKMAKDISVEEAIAEAVGPVKISAEGAKRVFERIEEQVFKEGERRGWHYSIYSDIANSINFRGIDIEGLPWIEIDTEEDLEKAHQIIEKILDQ